MSNLNQKISLQLNTFKVNLSHSLLRTSLVPEKKSENVAAVANDSNEKLVAKNSKTDSNVRKTLLFQMRSKFINGANFAKKSNGACKR